MSVNTAHAKSLCFILLLSSLLRSNSALVGKLDGLAKFVLFSLSGTILFMKESTPPSRFQRNKRCIIISIAITSICLLALILGLAIGLTRHHQGSSSGNSDAGVKNFPQEFVLSGNNFTISSQPTTRYYEFNITQRNGSPDGYQRTMLVVNGN